MHVLIAIPGLHDKSWSLLSNTVKLDRLADSLDTASLLHLEKMFAQWMVEMLRYQARLAIRKQKFPRKYAPLSPAYAQRKKDEGLKSGFWRATGFLEQSLTVWYDPSTRVWNLGWPKGLKHKASPDETVDAVARRVEFGDKERNIPARPLFTPLAQNAKKSVIRHFITFCARHFPQYLPLIDGSGVAEIVKAAGKPG